MKDFDIDELISIHAPLTGSDRVDKPGSWTELLFQSTLPLRGATGNYSVNDGVVSHFNPRSPYGERP